MCKSRRLVDEYAFPGFRPRTRVKGKPDDPGARVIILDRRQKKERCAVYAGEFTTVSMTARSGSSAICHAATLVFSLRWRYAVCVADDAAR